MSSLPPLSPEQLVKPRHFELRISLVFAFLFIPQGIHLPYFPLWLEARGFSPEQIAVILSAPMFLRVVTTPFVTAFADRAKDRANVLVALVAAALLINCGYFLEPSYATVLAVSLVLAAAWTPHSPLADSLALSGVRRFGSNYARMRIWGSISFLCANLAGGMILARTGTTVIPLLIAVGLSGALGAALLAPRLGRPRRASPLSASGMQAAAPTLLNRHFLLLAGGAGIVIGSHAFLYGFVSIYWKSLGLSDPLIGLLWAWSVIAEVCMFALFTRIFGRRSAATLLLLAALFAVARWLAFPLVWPMGAGVAGFFVVQAMHAFSTGIVIIGVQKLIAESVGEERTGAAQGIAYAANGTFMAVMTLLSGPLYDRFGPGGFHAMALVAALGLTLIALARLSAPQRGGGW
ncbi:MAG TPA: MFS transporter [Rhizobiaceae bacterium]|nr:MFS transporter [Rhizobiaceae bacterium]